MVFLALHGEYGEDGQVQSRLETLGVPYTGTDAAGSALAFDKARSKNASSKTKLLRRAEFRLILQPPHRPTPFLPHGFSPAAQGSSVGLNRVEDETEWGTALADSLQYGGAVLCEECIQGRELTVGILDGDTLPVVDAAQGGWIQLRKQIHPRSHRLFCPANLPDEVTAQCRLWDCAFEAVGAGILAEWMSCWMRSPSRIFWRSTRCRA